MLFTLLVLFCEPSGVYESKNATYVVAERQIECRPHDDGFTLITVMRNGNEYVPPQYKFAPPEYADNGDVISTISAAGVPQSRIRRWLIIPGGAIVDGQILKRVGH
jgi:hypothetical protein